MILALLLTLAHAQPVKTNKCVDKFLQKMASIKGYSADLEKNEMDDGHWNHEMIGLKVDLPNHIEYTFKAEGSSGIRNNGMRLTYDGTDRLAVKWGEARGFGVIALKAAKAVIGDTLELTGKDALKGEMLTLNRAGYSHLATIVKLKGKQMKFESDALCRVKFNPPESKFVTVHVTPDMKIQDLEEKYGTYAFQILFANSKEFDDLEELFNRDKPYDIQIPELPMPFEVDLGEDFLPERIAIFNNGEKIAEYKFTNLKTW